MRKQTKKLISLCMAIILLALGYPTNVSATERVENYSVKRIYQMPNFSDSSAQWFVMDDTGSERSTPRLTSCSISISCSSAGLRVSFYTNCSHTSEEIGVRDVKIQKQVGIFWSTVATSEGGSCGDDFVYGGGLLYSNAEYGATYRVSCTHFAYCGGYDLQGQNVTDGVKFTY